MLRSFGSFCSITLSLNFVCKHFVVGWKKPMHYQTGKCKLYAYLQKYYNENKSPYIYGTAWLNQCACLVLLASISYLILKSICFKDRNLK